MNISIINDCRDANVVGRQTTRAAALLNGPVSFVGVSSDLEAAGNLIDILDAYEDSAGVVLVNVAPRNGKAKKWANGTPFGYFWYKNILVVSSVDGLTLSLIKKLRLVDEIHVLDIPTVIAQFIAEGIVSQAVGEHIINTQFRSFDFVPRVAAYLLEHKDITSETLNIAEVVDAPFAIWWVDNFGNCKTTLLVTDIEKKDKIATAFGELDYYERLKDVPDHAEALIVGSSGLDNKRFLEIVVQGESAAKLLSVSSGVSVL